MRKLLFIWVLLLVAVSATAQDTIVSKMNSTFDCEVVDVDGYFLVIKLKQAGGETSRIAMNQIVSVKMGDSAKALILREKSIAFGVLLDSSPGTFSMTATNQMLGEINPLYQAGTDLRSAGGNLILGTVVMITGSIIATLPSVIEGGNSSKVALGAGILGLVFNVSGFSKLVESGRQLEKASKINSPY